MAQPKKRYTWKNVGSLINGIGCEYENATMLHGLSFLEFNNNNKNRTNDAKLTNVQVPSRHTQPHYSIHLNKSRLFRMAMKAKAAAKCVTN